MRNVSEEICRENQNTRFKLNNLFLVENRSVSEITWKNVAEPDWLQITIWRVRIACWISKSTNKFRICNTYCFCTAKMFARTRLTVRHTYIDCRIIYLPQSVDSFHKYAG